MAEGEFADARKRMPALEREIAGIRAEDVRIAVLGTVIDKKENTIVMDDGSGKITITFDEPANADISQLVRVIGRVIPMEDGFELQGEIAQDMGKLDMKLYKKVQKLAAKKG